MSLLLPTWHRDVKTLRHALKLRTPTSRNTNYGGTLETHPFQ